MRIITLCFALTLVSVASFGQLEISAGSSYEIPLGEMRDVYKGSPAYQLGFLKSHQYKKKRNSWGVLLGYASLTPRADTLYYEVETNNGIEYGAIHYENYVAYQLMFTGRYDILLSKKMEFFYGYDMGLHYTKFAYQLQGPYTAEDASEIIARIALSPKLGMSVELTKFVYLSVFGKYTISVGDTEDKKNIVNQYLGAGAALGFRLGKRSGD